MHTGSGWHVLQEVTGSAGERVYIVRLHKWQEKQGALKALQSGVHISRLWQGNESVHG